MHAQPDTDPALALLEEVLQTRSRALMDRCAGPSAALDAARRDLLARADDRLAGVDGLRCRALLAQAARRLDRCGPMPRA
jgi:hypothetical protein